MRKNELKLESNSWEIASSIADFPWGIKWQLINEFRLMGVLKTRAEWAARGRLVRPGVLCVCRYHHRGSPLNRKEMFAINQTF